jgi:hypothetical protein
MTTTHEPMVRVLDMRCPNHGQMDGHNFYGPIPYVCPARIARMAPRCIDCGAHLLLATEPTESEAA